MILAIIDHDNHQLFIETAPDTLIDSQEEYIKDKYGFTDDDTWSWEYLCEKIEVFGEDSKKIVENLINYN